MTKQLEAQLNAIFGTEPEEHNKTKGFYMLYVEGMGSPIVKHEDIDEARQEAERLSKKEGKPVHLLKAHSVCLAEESKLDVMALVDKAIMLDQHDIAKALLACSILADTASEYVPKKGLMSKMWFETAATLKF